MIANLTLYENLAFADQVTNEVLDSDDFLFIPNNQKCSYSSDYYSEARALIEKTTEFRNIKRRIKTPFHIAYLAKAVDKPIEYHGVCFDSVTVYIDRPERFELVLGFVVNRTNRHIYLQDLNGNYRRVIIGKN